MDQIVRYCAKDWAVSTDANDGGAFLLNQVEGPRKLKASSQGVFELSAVDGKWIKIDGSTSLAALIAKGR